MRIRRKFCLTALAAVMLVSVNPRDVLGGEEYKPKAKVTPLVQEPLPGVDGREVIVKEFELPPGFVGGRHSHPGPVYVYVIEGALTVDVDGLDRQTVPAGELYQEPIGRVMHARNLSTTQPTRIVVFQVGEQGKPMMIKAQ